MPLENTRRDTRRSVSNLAGASSLDTAATCNPDFDVRDEDYLGAHIGGSSGDKEAEGCRTKLEYGLLRNRRRHKVCSRIYMPDENVFYNDRPRNRDAEIEAEKRND